ncbi:MAG: deoxynucleoside kinase [Clostridia bacterium]|nr:deoxynucleoside kinase [Clostridia bacterium]
MGFLITVEAPDASGKATQTQMLLERLSAEGYKTYKFAFPNYGSDACKPVEMYLDGVLGGKPEDTNAYSASVLFAVDRFFSYRTEWKKLLDDENTVIVLDRYTTSNAVHQIVKLPEDEWDTFLSWLYDFEFKKMALPVPDITIALDVPPEVSKVLMDKRAKEDANHKTDIHEADTEYLRKCYEASKYASEKWNWQRISCTQNGEMLSRSEIHEKIYNAVKERL